ncbi:head-tail connector protein [Methanobrevibacter sp.]|uniref:head-tail connector protein n=1 Tax=Methanobrevibacter sp. TaxID=66852 RepID=UPI00388E1911
MNEISAVSQITAQDVADYLRISEVTQDDINTLNTLLTVAKAYISNYTGQTIENLDDFEDIIIVVLILCQDMWDNRTLYVDSSNPNKVVESILGLHSVNLL